MNAYMSALDLKPLMLDLLLVFTALTVLLIDTLMPAGRKRALGHLTGFMLIGLFGLSFLVDVTGTAFSGAYVGDAWALFFKRVFLACGALCTLGAVDYVDEHFPNRQGEFYLMLLASTLGMTLLAGARDLILLMVCFELMGMPLAVMAAYGKTEIKDGPDRQGAEAALKLYVTSAASSAITLFGLALVFGLAGSTRIDALSYATMTPLLTVGVLAAVAGMAFKIGAVPFHMWIPDTYQGAPTPVVAFLSVAPKAGGFAALALLLHRGFGAHQAAWLPAFLGLIVLTLLVGNLMALPQTNAKRLLAYSGVAQMGYLLMPLAIGTEQGTAVLLFYLAGYAVTNIGVFLVLHAVCAHQPDATIDAFAGLWHRAPGLALALLVFLLSLAGIPFAVGFWAKLYVFMAVYDAGLGWLVFLGAVLAVLALFYYLRVARSAYFDPPTQEGGVHVDLGLKLAIGTCLVAVIGMGLWPNTVVDAAVKAAAVMGG